MSREIKFRVWDKKRTRYEESDEYLLGCDGKLYRDWYSEPPEDISDDCVGEDQPRYVVEQYTGLKDKNGKEIYEGDILEIWIGGVKQIPPYIVTDLRELYLDFNRDDSYCCFSACRIIGNIHENPELLEKAK